MHHTRLHIAVATILVACQVLTAGLSIPHIHVDVHAGNPAVQASKHSNTDGTDAQCLQCIVRTISVAEAAGAFLMQAQPCVSTFTSLSADGGKLEAPVPHTPSRAPPSC